MRPGAYRRYRGYNRRVLDTRIFEPLRPNIRMGFPPQWDAPGIRWTMTVEGQNIVLNLGIGAAERERTILWQQGGGGTWGSSLCTAINDGGIDTNGHTIELEFAGAVEDPLEVGVNTFLQIPADWALWSGTGLALPAGLIFPAALVAEGTTTFAAYYNAAM